MVLFSARPTLTGKEEKSGKAIPSVASSSGVIKCVLRGLRLLPYFPPSLRCEAAFGLLDYLELQTKTLMGPQLIAVCREREREGKN